MKALPRQMNAQTLCATVAALIVLVACAPIGVPQQTSDGNASEAGQSAAPIGGYPAPEITPIVVPTEPGPVVTADPKERLVVADIAAAEAAYGTDYSYTIKQELVPNTNNNTVNRVVVSIQGKDLLLGEGKGSAFVLAQSPDWVIWTYHSEAEINGMGSEKTDEIGPPGVYALEIATGQYTLVIPDVHSGPPAFRVWGDWLLFADGDGAPGQPVSSDAPTDYNLRLRAFNLRVPKEPISLTEQLPFVWGAAPNAFFGISDGRIAWLEYHPKEKSYSLVLYDVEGGSGKPIEMKLERPSWISIAGDLIVWRDTYWKGYSLSSGDIFTIPSGPKEYESRSGTIVAAIPSGVQWQVLGPDDTFLYFRAVVAPK